jgi:hypothetical protein
VHECKLLPVSNTLSRQLIGMEAPPTVWWYPEPAMRMDSKAHTSAKMSNTGSRHSSTRAVPSRGFLLALAALQGLTLVHFSAQPKPFWSYLPVSPCLIDWGKIMHPTYPTNYAYNEPKSG